MAASPAADLTRIANENYHKGYEFGYKKIEGRPRSQMRDFYEDKRNNSEQDLEDWHAFEDGLAQGDNDREAGWKNRVEAHIAGEHYFDRPPKGRRGVINQGGRKTRKQKKHSKKSRKHRK